MSMQAMLLEVRCLSPFVNFASTSGGITRTALELSRRIPTRSTLSLPRMNLSLERPKGPLE